MADIVASAWKQSEKRHAASTFGGRYCGLQTLGEVEMFSAAVHLETDALSSADAVVVVVVDSL